MTNVTTLDFPDINDAFKGANSTSQICSNYIEILNNSNSITNIQYSNKLLEFLDAEEQIHYLEQEFHEFKHFLREWSQKNEVKVILKTRRKNFFSLNAKIRLFLCRNDDLSLIRDLLGFKLILCCPGSERKAKRLCYKLVNDTLFFFAAKRKCILLDAEKAISLDSCMELVPELKKKVKDYFSNSRDDNYQALHCSVKSRSGLVFEIQTLTLDMSLKADETHNQHKQDRYANMQIDFDYTKINLPDVRFDKDGNLLCDYAGLFESTNIFDKI